MEKVYEAEEKYENTEDAKHALTPTKGHRTCAEARRVLVHARGASVPLEHPELQDDASTAEGSSASHTTSDATTTQHVCPAGRRTFASM